MKKNIIIVLTSVFLLALGAYISGTILTPYALSKGASWLSIGILMGSMYFVRVFAGVPVGKLADRIGIVAVLRYSLILYPVVAVFYLFSNGVPGLIGSRMLHGLASAMMLPMAMAYIGECSPEGQEGRYMSVYNLVFLVASGIGPLVSTILAGIFDDYRSSFILLFVLAVISLMIIFTLPKSRQLEDKAADREVVVTGEKPDGKRLWKNKQLLALGFINIALAAISSLVSFFMIPFLKEKGMALYITGSIIAVYNIASGLLQIPLGHMVDRGNRYVLVLLAGFATAISLLLFPLARGFLFMILVTGGVAVTSAFLLAAVSALYAVVGKDCGIGKTMGFVNTATAVGMVFGCIALSLMPGTKYGLAAFFYLASMIMMVCVGLFAVWWRSHVQTKTTRFSG